MTQKDFDKELIISRVADLLKEMPSGKDTVRKGKRRNERFLFLARTMVDKAIREDALLLEDDGKGIAILLKEDGREGSVIKELGTNLKLIFKVTGLRRAYNIWKNRQYIKKQRPQGQPYLYAWFWGVVKGERGAETQTAARMKNRMLAISEQLGYPLYAETRLRVNAVVYQRYDFELFHTWEEPGGSTMWFLRYVPKSMKSPEGL